MQRKRSYPENLGWAPESFPRQNYNPDGVSIYAYCPVVKRSPSPSMQVDSWRPPPAPLIISRLVKLYNSCNLSIHLKPSDRPLLQEMEERGRNCNGDGIVTVKNSNGKEQAYTKIVTPKKPITVPGQAISRKLCKTVKSVTQYQVLL